MKPRRTRRSQRREMLLCVLCALCGSIFEGEDGRALDANSEFQTVRHRQLGRTGLTVSALSLGTVSLGIDYGIRAPGDFGRPTENDAIKLVREALDRGITFIDTSPGYGDAERIVGLAA